MKRSFILLQASLSDVYYIIQVVLFPSSFNLLSLQGNYAFAVHVCLCFLTTCTCIIYNYIIIIYNTC